MVRAPAAVGDAGIGKVIAVADWLPNVAAPDGIVRGDRQRQADAFMRAFRARFPKPQDDYVHMRMQLMVEALAQALGGAREAPSLDVAAVAQRLAQAKISLFGQTGQMRGEDHQFQQPLVVGVMDRQGAPGVKYDVEGSGYGFRVIRVVEAPAAAQPSACGMKSWGA